MLNVILMTDGDPVDSWVACKLAQKFPISHSILLDVDALELDRRNLGERLLMDPLRLLSAIPRELMIRQVEGQRERIMTEQLWLGEQPSLAEILPNVIKVAPGEMNSEAMADRLRRLNPDLILVCGGAILAESIYSIPRLGSWNLQWGISDCYRGQHGIFFPLAAQEFDAIGATIHRIDSGINRGEVLCQLYPELEPTDCESSIEIKIAHRIVPILLELLNEVQALPANSQVSGQSPKAAGQLMKYRDRSATKEMKHQLRCKLGSNQIPKRSERQKRYLSITHPVQVPSSRLVALASSAH